MCMLQGRDHASSVRRRHLRLAKVISAEAQRCNIGRGWRQRSTPSTIGGVFARPAWRGCCRQSCACSGFWGFRERLEWHCSRALSARITLDRAKDYRRTSPACLKNAIPLLIRQADACWCCTGCDQRRTQCRSIIAGCEVDSRR